MGFYGNITNTSRTQFSFDKVYSSRWAMDQGCSTDNIYAGRYVLVEYETDFSEDHMLHGLYYWGGDLYSQMDFSHGPDICCGPIGSTKATTTTGIKGGEIAKITADRYFINANTTAKYIKITDPDKLTYFYISEYEYEDYWSGRLPNLKDPTSVHGHIINGEVVPANNIRVKDICLCIPPNFMYDLGGDDSYWLATVVDGQVIWKQITDPKTNLMAAQRGRNYLINFNIDTSWYGLSRGYDSTVWQKVYSATADNVAGSPNQGRYEKYVMVAELNSVVPTFDLCSDAPTMLPSTPHFDVDSNNVYYRIHMQPQWGIRTKAAKSSLYGPTIENNGSIGEYPWIQMSSDNVIYPSDQTTNWKSAFINNKTSEKFTRYYNQKTQSWSDKESDLDAAVYFNKAGFNPEEVIYSKDILTSGKSTYSSAITKSGWADEDAIRLQPTGLSGHLYTPHENFSDVTPQEDIQELSIMLPSLGNTIAEMWDLVYGGRETNDYIRDTSVRNLDIAWEDASYALERNGLRLVNNDPNGNGFSLTDKQVNTFAGCINSVHDLMGMIIVDNASSLVNSSNIDQIDENAIYYYPEEKMFKRKAKDYKYNEIKYDYIAVPNVTAENYTPNYYYLNNSGSSVATGNFATNTTYYGKVISSLEESEIYVPVTPSFTHFAKGLYYKTLKNEWVYEHSDIPMEGVSYYRLTNKEPIDLDAEYLKNTYFYRDGTSYVLSQTEHANSDRQPYYKIDGEEKVNLNMKDPERYLNNLYYPENTNLYDDTEEPVGETLKYLYVPGRFFYQEFGEDNTPTGQFLKENRTVDQLKDYWDPTTNMLKVPLTNSKGNLIKDVNGKTQYRQYLMVNTFDQKNNGNNYTIDKDGNIVIIAGQTGLVGLGNIYYVDLIKFKQGETLYYFVSQKTGVETENGTIENRNGRYTLLTFDLLQEHYDLQFVDPNSNRVPIFKDYYTFTPIEQGAFYIPGKFWYETQEKNFVIDNSTRKTLKRQYYKSVSFSKVNANYYLPNKYYRKDPESGQYYISLTKDFEDGITYYQRKDLYVLADDFNIYPNGSIWNYKVGIIPASVKLAKRTEGWKMEELIGFARSLNTIHGLILKINHLLEFNDTQTRRDDTVQGLINKMNDCIAKINDLTPNQFTIIDSYGRIHSAPISTAQEFSTTNLQNSHSAENNYNKFEAITVTASNYEPNKYYYKDGDNYVKSTNLTYVSRQYYRETENRWINVKINPDPIAPSITVKHNITPVNSTTTRSDKNIALTQPSNNSFYTGNNNSISDSLDLYTPIVDAQGHVVGKNIETVTLPYGFKTIQAENFAANGAETQWSQANSATKSTGESVRNIVADNTKDSLKFKGGNKWIRFQTSPTTDAQAANSNSQSTGLDNLNTLTIAHETHNFDTTEVTETNLNTEVGAVNESNINIPDWEYDLAGHIKAKKTHKYTLPYSFKTIATNGRGTNNSTINTGDDIVTTNVVADQTQDTLNINSGNRWIRIDTDATNDALTFSHDIHTITTTEKPKDDLNVKVNNQIVNTITLQDLSFDNAGHMTANQPHTYELPYGFKTFSIAAQSNAVTGITTSTSATTVTADNTQDTMSIISGNKWLQIVASDVNNSDQITFAHEIHNTSTSASADSLSKTSSETVTFNVPTYSFDEAGHYTGVNNKTLTMPFGYGIFTTDVLDSKASATATFDTLALTGDSWIQTSADTDTIKFAHQNPVNTDHINISNVTPAFGETITITDLTFDTKGHKANEGTHTVLIPGLELTSAISGNVVTGIGYSYDSTNHKGIFTESKDFAGNLLLGTYTAATDETVLDLTSNVSISSAFAILDKKLANEISAREDTDSRVDNLESKSNPTFESIESEGIYLLKFTIDDDGNKIPEWVQLETWNGGQY